LQAGDALEYGSAHISENSMTFSSASQSIISLGALRAVPLCGQVVAAEDYYFGYWFSRRRV